MNYLPGRQSSSEWHQASVTGKAWRNPTYWAHRLNCPATEQASLSQMHLLLADHLTITVIQNQCTFSRNRTLCIKLWSSPRLADCRKISQPRAHKGHRTLQHDAQVSNDTKRLNLCYKIGFELDTKCISFSV